ncbi:RluA family pseudouridine synthase [Lichenihabitans sp. Uapishka_5]|uniref:RluA family pseudouridine synthase n=1 Tax=Lichenihabitans sp. Uapishka_5 TaxID=3037302 RepID=UPI0029E7ED1D|nr:RluA family pseudouridine synthase [Lichenihabitans sp. Uapishka_5]MDX7950452.1 RluA family pseudouridine synthase [Lichenihabitans sp. Uapishka_5]
MQTLRDAQPALLDEAGGSTGLFHVEVGSEQAGGRLDRVLAEAAEAAGLPLSRTRLQRLIAEGHVRLGETPITDARAKLPAGSLVTIAVPPPEPAEPIGQDIQLNVVFEDDHLIVIDKPAGLVVHPSAGHADGTLVNALIAHCGDSLSGIGGVRRPGIVHRLDRDTSGLLVVAKTDAAHAGLAAIFADHGRSGSLVRDYHAFVWGVPDRPSGSVEAALGRDVHNRLKVAIVPAHRGRHAVTHWSREATFGQAALLRCRLETGRTHQIRVHLTSIGHPVIGDATYGTGFRTKADRLEGPARAIAAALSRQALHATTLGFEHPITGDAMLFHSVLPPDLASLAAALQG